MVFPSLDDHAAPFGIAAEYAHPVETLFLGFGSMIGPILCATHLFEVWVWLCFRLLQTVEVHCGYNFPWAPHNWVPFWAGARYHDEHHRTFTGNYASTFVIWDAVFGTDKLYRSVIAAEEAKAAKLVAEKAPVVASVQVATTTTTSTPTASTNRGRGKSRSPRRK